ncbi:MAG TPA: DegT/DnrJ/EryC1/StrS family aminotransferase [Gemmatimonadaceae bacterium]|nr:DegT/DnrJ/EryC1/StrS family aminotransferase [Gemmatimonadaceae bacterium]
MTFIHAVTLQDAGGASRVEEYERQFAELAGGGYALSFTYARTALVAILRAAGLRPGDEVLLSPLTCKVVPLAVLAGGFRPVYVDIDSGTLNLDPARAATALTPRTRAVLFQRTYGLAGGASEAMAFARARDLCFVEDSAQCMPSPGSWCGDVAVFSANGGKPLSAGSGGVAVFRDPALARAVAELRGALPVAPLGSAVRARIDAWVRNRLLTPRLYWPALELARRASASYRPRPIPEEIASEVTAPSARLHPLHAAGGLHAVAGAAQVARHRAASCVWYASALGECSTLASTSPAGEGLYYFPVMVRRKQDLLREASRRGVEIVPWPVTTPIYPVTDVEQLGRYGYVSGTCPVAEEVAAGLVGLPTDPRVSGKERERAVALVREFLRGDE